MNGHKHILIVEDDARDVELMLEALSEHKFANRIKVIRDGANALDYLYKRGDYIADTDDHPVLILLDLKMPKVDGLDVLRQIKGDPSLRRIPVVMLTSSKEQSDLLMSYDLGVNSYLVKPLQFQTFVGSVKQLGVYWVLVNEPPPGRSANE